MGFAIPALRCSSSARPREAVNPKKKKNCQRNWIKPQKKIIYRGIYPDKTLVPSIFVARQSYVNRSMSGCPLRGAFTRGSRAGAPRFFFSRTSSTSSFSRSANERERRRLGIRNNRCTFAGPARRRPGSAAPGTTAPKSSWVASAVWPPQWCRTRPIAKGRRARSTAPILAGPLFSVAGRAARRKSSSGRGGGGKRRTHREEEGGGGRRRGRGGAQSRRWRTAGRFRRLLYVVPSPIRRTLPARPRVASGTVRRRTSSRWTGARTVERGSGSAGPCPAMVLHLPCAAAAAELWNAQTTINIIH